MLYSLLLLQWDFCSASSSPSAALPRGRALLILLLHCCRSSTNPAVRDSSLQLCSWWRHFMSYLSIPQANATEFLLFNERNPLVWVFIRKGLSNRTLPWDISVLRCFSPSLLPKVPQGNLTHSGATAVSTKKRIHPIFLPVNPAALPRQTAQDCGLVEFLGGCTWEHSLTQNS